MRSKKILTKDYILNIAEDVFAEYGIKDSTLAKIAKKAKISKGTLYYYYSAKKDIILDVADRHLNIINENIKNFSNALKNKALLNNSIKELFLKVFINSNYNSIHLSILSEATKDKELKEKINVLNMEWLSYIENSLKKYCKVGSEKCSGIAQIILSVINSSSFHTKNSLEDISVIIAEIL